LDARPLTIRNDDPIHPSLYLIRLYFTSTTPPNYRPNFEFDIIITPPLKSLYNSWNIFKLEYI